MGGGDQVCCKGGFPAVQCALLAGSGALLESQAQRDRLQVLAILLGALQVENQSDCTSWRGRLAFAEQGAACAALLSQQARACYTQISQFS